MPINPVFSSNYNGAPEQDLVQDLIIESIQIHGLDVKYIPREQVAFDQLFGQDLLSRFDTTYTVEMYIKSFDQFGGDGDLFSRMDIEIRDELTLQVAMKRFEDLVTCKDSSLTRPREGDLIYFPFTKQLFEIKFVEHEEVFHQIGKLFTYELRCHLFEYNAEDFETGDPEIDRIEDYALRTEIILDAGGTGDFVVGEIVQQSDGNAGVQASGEVVEWTPNTLYVKDVAGEFLSGGENIIGQTSGADWVYSDPNFQNQTSNDNLSDNNFIEDEFSEFDVPTSTNRLS